MPKRKTQDEFIKESKSKFGDRFYYTEVKYINSTTKVRISCRDHGLFLITPKLHLRGNGGCKICSGVKKLTPEQFRRNATKVHKGEYDYSLVKNIKNTKTKVDIICAKHGVFSATPNCHISHGSGCPSCAIIKNTEKLRSSTKNFIESARLIHGNKYDYSKVKYTQNKTPVTIICSIHGEFCQKPNSHISGGSGCPKCRGSKGEGKIRRELKSLGYEASEQKIFDKCRDKAYLRFDFYLTDENILIEFQGEQHYRVGRGDCFWGGEEGFINRRRRDQIKRDFCAENNIPLLEIRYDDKNWKRKLKNFINKNGHSSR